MPRPKVTGPVIDFHCHILAARHARVWFQTARHYGIDCFMTMGPLEEAAGLLRDHPGQIHLIAVPQWGGASIDDWLRRLEAFYNLGSRIVKFHMAPQTMVARNWRLDSPQLKPVFDEILARKMGIMTHIGDPDLWYETKYADTARFGAREEHYRIWEDVMTHYRQVPWIGAHLGGNPENLPRLQYLLDKFPNLSLDCSATRWMLRELSQRRNAAREFFIHNQDRILFGSDQVSGDDRGFDFLASRFWCHRKLWETAYIGRTPVFDPDLLEDQQPMLHGLALPDATLQKLYHTNAVKFLTRLGVTDFPATSPSK